MTTKAIRIHTTGGPEQLQWETIPTPTPRGSEILLRHVAVGLNYIDTYHRSGLYKLPQLPAILGVEGVGIVEQCGPEATLFRPGDRVAYATGPVGAYATHRVIPERHCVGVPASLPSELVAAGMLKGMTAHYLVRRTLSVRPGMHVLVHAAAGGVGLLLCQWAKYLGATVIGTVGDAEKAALAKAHGCDHPILYRETPFVAKVRELTGGAGVNVVYDSVGKDSFMDSLDCLMPLGLMVSYGQSSGPIPPLDISLLMKKGSLFLTRPTLFDYQQSHTELLATCAELFDLLQKNILKLHVGQSYYLKDAARAHRDLEARKTKGASVFLFD